MSFDKLMEELKAEYIESLPTKISELKKNSECEDISALKENFHKLKGTGKTYGLPEVSLLSAAMERLFEEKVDQAKLVLPEALRILKEIQETRSQQGELHLDQDHGFREIQNLLKNTTSSEKN